MVVIANNDVGTTGFGLMSFAFSSPSDLEQHAFPTMRAALAAGATFWNGGEFYGALEGPNSLTLLNAYFAKYPEDAAKVTLSIKGGRTPDGKFSGTRDNMRACVDRCLRQLPPSVKKIDVYQCARVDPEVPVETTIGALAELVVEGKIGGIGISEVSAKTVERAAAVHEIAAVEIELSMFETRNISNGVLKACAAHKIPVVAYSPLGVGFLAGRFKSVDDLPKDDPRRGFPMFSEENFPKNIKLVEKVREIAGRQGCTPAQLALAWVRHFNGQDGFPQILPLPGASRVERVEENMKAVPLKDAKELDGLMDVLIKERAGPRYPEHTAVLSEG